MQIHPSDTLIHREATYTGAWYYSEADYPHMLAMAAEGLPLAKLRTHVFPAEEAKEAYRTFTSRVSGKVVLRWTNLHDRR